MVLVGVVEGVFDDPLDGDPLLVAISIVEVMFT